MVEYMLTIFSKVPQIEKIAHTFTMVGAGFTLPPPLLKKHTPLPPVFYYSYYCRERRIFSPIGFQWLALSGLTFHLQNEKG